MAILVGGGRGSPCTSSVSSVLPFSCPVLLPLPVLIAMEGLSRERARGLHLCLAQGTLGEQSPSRFFMSLIGDLQTEIAFSLSHPLFH